jgi:hypothetical protein
MAGMMNTLIPPLSNVRPPLRAESRTGARNTVRRTREATCRRTGASANAPVWVPALECRRWGGLLMSMGKVCQRWLWLAWMALVTLRCNGTSEGQGGLEAGAGPNGDGSSADANGTLDVSADARDAGTSEADRSADGSSEGPATEDASDGGLADVGRDASSSDEARADDANDAGVVPDAGTDGTFDAAPDRHPQTEGGLIIDPGPCGAPAPGPVPANELLDLGHGNYISLVRRSGSYVLTRDWDSHWILWNTSNHSRTLAGDSPQKIDVPSTWPEIGYLDLRGGTLAVETEIGKVELHSAATGALLSTIAIFSDTIGFGYGPKPRAFGLATDGSYFWETSPAKLKVWSSAGASLVDRDGNYAAVNVYAAPGELRIGRPSGSSSIEVVDVTTNMSTMSPTFSGSFRSWFVDGESFLSSLGRTVWVYPKSATAAKGIFLDVVGSVLSGQGDFFWTFDQTPQDSLHIYSIGGGMGPILSPPGQVLQAGDITMIGRIYRGDTFPGRSAGVGLWHAGALDVVSFDSGAPTITTFAVGEEQPHVFVRAREGTWSYGTLAGVVYGKDNVTPGPVSHVGGCGAATSIAAANDGTIAIATRSTGIILGSVTDNGKAIRGRLPVVRDRVELSAAGDILAAGPTGTAFGDRTTLRVFSLPSGTEIQTSADAGLDENVADFSLAAGRSRIGRISGAPSGLTRTVTSLDGSVVDFTDTVGTQSTSYMPWLRLSPDGTLIAAPDGTPSPTVTSTRTAPWSTSWPVSRSFGWTISVSSSMCTDMVSEAPSSTIIPISSTWPALPWGQLHSRDLGGHSWFCRTNSIFPTKMPSTMP